MEHGGSRSGAGRPTGAKASHTLEAEAVREYLIEQAIKNKEAIIAALIEQAKEGKIPAIKELLERVLGKPQDMAEFYDKQETAERMKENDKMKQAVKDIINLGRQAREKFKSEHGYEPPGGDIYLD